MSNADDVEMTFEDIANIYEENQDELADLILQEVPFYNFIKSEPAEELDSAVDAQEILKTEDKKDYTVFDCNKVASLLQCDLAVADITDIAHEETCCSNDCYSTEMAGSPLSGSISHLSPTNRKKCNSSRRNRTPNTVRHMMEKHRHSERKRHHSLNERLKAICQMVPGSTQDNKETKVVMMQRVISYIAYLENTIKMLCAQIHCQPDPSWVLLTTNFALYFKDYFKGIDDLDAGDGEVSAATKNLSQSLKEEDSCANSHPKVSSPTVDSTTDCVVPDIIPAAEEEVVVMSQDSGVPSSSHAEDDDHISQLWAMCGNNQEVPGIGDIHGDTDVFFSSSVDDGVSAVLEISSTNHDDDTHATDSDAGYIEGIANWKRKDRDQQPFVPDLQSLQHSITQRSSVHNFYTIKKHVPEIHQRRNKRKQLSPRRSASQDDYLSDRAYLPSWPSEPHQSAVLHPEQEENLNKVRVLPYNIRCNHRHPVQRLQANASKMGFERPAPVHVVKPLPEATRILASKTQDKLSPKLDLRKASWMNGFMMFSRLNRRSFIQAHPGVHTSHISKIMGHAWRNMSKEEQAPYKEKAKLCASELYRVYTNQPEFTLCSAISTAGSAPAAYPISVPSVAGISQPLKVESSLEVI